MLVCAPTRLEAAACRRGLADAGVADAEVLRTGVGAARAAAALSARLRAGPRPRLVVSSGFAGALTPGVALHAVVTAAALHRLGAGGAVPVALPDGALRPLARALACAVATADAVRIGGGSGLRAPAAVDMESAALAETAASAGVPVAVLRVVSDTLEAPFPPLARLLAAALAAGPRPAALLPAARAVASAARHPGAAVALVRSSVAAARALRRAWRERGRA